MQKKTLYKKWKNRMNGKMNENHLEQVLSNISNFLEIEQTGGKDNHKGDFILKDNDIEIWIEKNVKLKNYYELWF